MITFPINLKHNGLFDMKRLLKCIKPLRQIIAVFIAKPIELLLNATSVSPCTIP